MRHVGEEANPKLRNSGSLRACPEAINGKKQTNYYMKTKCQNVFFSAIYLQLLYVQGVYSAVFAVYFWPFEKNNPVYATLLAKNIVKIHKLNFIHYLSVECGCVLLPAQHCKQINKNVTQKSEKNAVGSITFANIT